MPAVSESAAPPDIVLIVTDDQRWDTLWAMPILSERLIAARFGHGAADHATEVLADEAVALVKGSTGPLFLELATSAPHEPAIPSPGDEDAFADLPPARPPSLVESGGVAENAPSSEGPWIG